MVAHSAIFCASENDWSVPSCPERYSYDYQTADVREEWPTHRGGRNFSGSKPRFWEGVTVPNMIDINDIFDAMEKRVRRRLEDGLTTPIDDLSPVVPSNVEDVSPVVEGSVVTIGVDSVSDVAPVEGGHGKGHTVESRRCRNRSGVMVQTKKGFVLTNLLLSMHGRMVIWFWLLPTLYLRIR